MIISTDNPTVWITSCPKCGSNTVRHAVQGKNGPNDRKTMHDRDPEGIPNGVLLLAMVRNPFERLVSAWAYEKVLITRQSERKNFPPCYKVGMPFEEWFHYWCTEPSGLNLQKAHHRGWRLAAFTQTWFYEPLAKRIDGYLRLEHLEEDLDRYDIKHREVLQLNDNPDRPWWPDVYNTELYVTVTEMELLPLSMYDDEEWRSWNQEVLR